MEYSNAYIMVKSLILTRKDVKSYTFGQGFFILEKYNCPKGETFYFSGDNPTPQELDELVLVMNECCIKCECSGAELSEDNC